MNSGNKSITFVGGGVNSNNSKSSLFVGWQIYPNLKYTQIMENLQ
jgi:hypothetical protein